MEYKGDRDSLKTWMVKMDTSDKLESHVQTHGTPPDIKNL